MSKHMNFRYFAISFVLCVLSACTQTSMKQGLPMQNPAVYFEIPVSDMSRATAFYSAVFSYDFAYESIHGNSMAMLPFYDEASGITGALAKGKIYKPSLRGVLIYLHTDNIDQTLEKIILHGGKTLFPKTLSGSYGYVAEFKDSEGNRIGLFEKK